MNEMFLLSYHTLKVSCNTPDPLIDQLESFRAPVCAVCDNAAALKLSKYV